MHLLHVNRLIRVSDHVAKTCGEDEPIGKRRVHEASRLESPERVGIALRRPEVEAETGGYGEVDDDLHGLPQVQDHGIRRVGRGPKVAGVTRQALANAPQMPLDGHGTFGEKLRVKLAHLR